MRSLFIILLVFTTTSSIAQFGSAEKFDYGHYYNSSGEKINGFIDVEPNEKYIYYRPAEKGHDVKIKIDEIRSLVLYDGGKVSDTLVVLTEDGDDSKKYFAEPIAASNVTSFYHKYKFNHFGSTASTSSFSPGSEGKGIFTSKDIIVPMYSDNGTTHELTKKNFKDILNKAFADDADLALQITNGDFKFKELNDIFDAYGNYLATKSIKK